MAPGGVVRCRVTTGTAAGAAETAGDGGARVKGFYGPAAQSVVRRAIADAEGATSAEIVVVVHVESGAYRDSDQRMGLVVALLALCVFLYHPAEFDFTYLPLELALSFGIGLLLSLGVPPLRRALTSRRRMDAAVRSAARAAFVERGVHRTRGRTGVLVLVSTFEKRVELVGDVGVDESTITADLRSRFEASVGGNDVGRFADAVRELGTALGRRLPRQHDDVNELGDAVVEAA